MATCCLAFPPKRIESGNITALARDPPLQATARQQKCYGLTDTAPIAETIGTPISYIPWLPLYKSRQSLRSSNQGSPEIKHATIQQATKASGPMFTDTVEELSFSENTLSKLTLPEIHHTRS